MDMNKKSLYWSLTKVIWIIYAVAWVLLCLTTELTHPSRKDVIGFRYFLEIMYIGVGIGCIALQYLCGYLHFIAVSKSLEGFVHTDKQLKNITIFTCSAMLIGCYVPLVYFVNILYDNMLQVYTSLSFILFAIECYVARKNIGLRLITYMLYVLAFSVPTPFLYLGYTWLKDGLGHFHG